MEEYENNNLNPQEPQPQPEMPANEPAQEAAPQPQPGYYHGAGAGRRESTYEEDYRYAAYTAYHTPRNPEDAYRPPYYQHPYYQQPYYQQGYYREPEKKKKGGKVLKTLLASVLVIALVFGSSVGTYLAVQDGWQKEYDAMKLYLNEKIDVLEQQLQEAGNTGSAGNSGSNSIAPVDGMSPSQIYDMNIDSVVAVNCKHEMGSSAGSGFVLTEDGYFVTNYHVIEGASKITVTLASGESFLAVVRGYDQTNDIAVLKADVTGLDPVAIGSSNAMQVGDQVVAIGNALGELSYSLTVGYISGTDREVATDGSIINMLQTDVAINSGNSGGPLFNTKGEVIGITTAKYSGTTSSGASIEGISFAIPIDDVKRMIEDLQQHGYVTGAYLGVSVSNVESSAQAYGVPAGAYVVEVVPGIAAAEAGILPGDIIIELGGYDVTSVNTLTRALRNFSANDTSTVTVWRSGREIILTITFNEKPQVNG